MNRAHLEVLVGLALAVTTGCARTTSQGAAGGPLHHDPVAVFQRMDQATLRITRGTADMPERDYQRARPRLAVRLERLSFTPEQAQQILVRVDEARADRARLRAWWASLGEPAGSGGSQQARAQR